MENNQQQPAETTAAAPLKQGAPAGPVEFDAFDDNAWVEKAPSQEPAPAQESVQQPAPAPDAPAASEPVTPVSPANDEIIDEDAWVKKHFNLDSVDAVRAALQSAQPKEETFANEASKKLYEAWKNGKEDDVFNFLSQKKELDRISKLELTKSEEAAEILKTNLRYKHPDLTKDEVEYLFNKQHSIPNKPSQREDQTEEEYQESLSSWKQQVEQVERGMIIEAKLAKPELLKYQSQLVLPDIPKTEPAGYQPTQEELAAAKKQQEDYLRSVDKGLGDFKGFSVEYKDEEVTIPINYEVTPEEKNQLKQTMQSLYEGWGPLQERWANPDGSFNTKAIAEDLYLLKNKDRIFSKIASESANQRLAQKIKADSNIQLNDGSSQQRFQPGNERSQQEQAVDAMWDKY